MQCQNIKPGFVTLVKKKNVFDLSSFPNQLFFLVWPGSPCTFSSSSLRSRKAGSFPLAVSQKTPTCRASLAVLSLANTPLISPFNFLQLCKTMRSDIKSLHEECDVSCQRKKNQIIPQSWFSLVFGQLVIFHSLSQKRFHFHRQQHNRN